MQGMFPRGVPRHVGPTICVAHISGVSSLGGLVLVKGTTVDSRNSTSSSGKFWTLLCWGLRTRLLAAGWRRGWRSRASTQWIIGLGPWVFSVILNKPHIIV